MSSMISSSSQRAPSPDSACEQDWAPYSRNERLIRDESASSSFSTSEDITSDLSEAGSHSSSLSQRNLSGVLSSENAQSGMSLKVLVVKGLHGQDSDVDSGIVECRRHGQRIGSTSSADTDSSQETASRKSKYSSEGSQEFAFWNNLKVNHKVKNSHSSGPVKADHTVLKECNRRPPTPLSVLQDTLHQQVRFDDELHLSEQNIRRSCKKLFATLYAQRLSEPNQHVPVSRGRLSLPSSNNTQTCLRPRRHTLPECDLINQRNISTPSVCPTSCNLTCNSNLDGKEDRLSLRTSANSLPNDSFNKSALSIKSEITQCERLSALHRLNRLENSNRDLLCHPTGHCYETPSVNLSSPNTHSHNTSSSNHSHSSSKTLFKSRSCSTLVSPQLTLNSLHSSAYNNSYHPPMKSTCMHKTPSCSNLCNCVYKHENKEKFPFQNSMIRVYAQLASVIPDNGDDNVVHYNSNIDQTISDKKDIKINKTCDNHNSHLDKLKLHNNSNQNESSNVKCDNNKAEGNNRVNEKYTPPKISVQDVINHQPSLSTCQKDQVLTSQENKDHSYEYSSVKLPELSSSDTSVSKQKPQSHQHLLCQTPVGNRTPNGNKRKEVHNITKQTEVEYAVIDRSKKNRYLSLPSLSRVTSHTCIVEGSSDEQEPPVPPKKFMHKSDIALYSGSTPSRKSFFERVQVLTKSAKSAIQKAFSTERIYRPEKEERLEATGQKLLRSKSFIKGLKNRMSSRHKKGKAKSSEILHQTSFSPSWNEDSSGASPTHVWGQMIQLNVDGSQVVELTKPSGKPYGFFVARGRVKSSKGVFVSRMRDKETQKLLAGLLDVGDEILEIDGSSVKNADIMEVNNLMSNKGTLLLTVLPYICRKDI